MRRDYIMIYLLLFVLLFAGCASRQNTMNNEIKPSVSERTEVTKVDIPIIQTPNNIMEIEKGQTISLEVVGFENRVSWTSSDPYCISVDENGEIKGGPKGGNATITATNMGQNAQITLKNNVSMRDITSEELVSELKFGGDWNDQVTIIKREIAEITSMPINVGFTIWEDGMSESIFSEGQPIMQEQTISEEIMLPEIPNELGAVNFSKASLNFWYSGDKQEEQAIIVTVANAKVTVEDKVYELTYMNGTHKIDMFTGQDSVNGLWFCGGAIGDQNQSGLPLPEVLTGGVFSADITLDKFDSDFEDIQRYLCASTGGDVPLTKEMIIEAKNAGFDFLRIPFTFSNFMSEDFVISEAYLDELEQVVNLVLDADLYCLIDSSEDYLGVSWVGDHYERNWLDKKYKDYVNARYQAAWQQIAERFKTYDDYLLFGNFNEFNGDDGLDNDEPYGNSRFAPSNYELERLNEMTELFIKTVTSTGENNAMRHLYISGWNAGWEENILNALKFPDYNRLIGSVHYYYYVDGGDERVSSWSSNNPDDVKQVDLMFNNLKTKFLDQGIPVMLTEFGTREILATENRIDQATYILNTAKELSIPCTWFEGGGWFKWEDGESMALFDRNKMVWQYPELLDSMKKIYGE